MKHINFNQGQCKIYIRYGKVSISFQLCWHKIKTKDMKRHINYCIDKNFVNKEYILKVRLYIGCNLNLNIAHTILIIYYNSG